MDAQQTSIFSAVLIACIVLAVIITYFIISIIRHQRRNQELYKSKIQAEINTLEKERSRIASDLHDELGPILSTVKLRINCIDIISDEDQLQLNKANKHIDDIIQRMREISNDLMPTTLLRKGLIVALNEFIGNISKPGGLRIKFTYERVPELASDRAIHLYRILQEIIHNTIKHAGATELTIGLSFENGQVMITTQDNGTGFDYNRAIKENTGFGLRNLLSRAEIMGGAMYIESAAGQGTQYIFEIPFNF
jgi:signal transduction histidine kinase